MLQQIKQNSTKRRKDSCYSCVKIKLFTIICITDSIFRLIVIRATFTTDNKILCLRYLLDIQLLYIAFEERGVLRLNEASD